MGMFKTKSFIDLIEEIQMKQILILFFLLLFGLNVFATHNRAGEITYRQLSQFTYEFTVITYTKTTSPADKPTLEMFWGDGTSDSIPRVEKTQLPHDMNRNKYMAVHTFPGPSVFAISYIDPNRNKGVVNIPNSVEIPFFVETILVLNPFLGYNNSPQLLQPPIDDGCKGSIFTHNPGAYDPDGDSLSFRLIYCKGKDGVDIPGYTYPAASKSFTLDPITGDMVWDAPIVSGEYNVAFLIEEWRFGIQIGSVERDMQIEIAECINVPPVIDPIADICVEAGALIKFTVTATDPNKNDFITLTASGGPFKGSNPAQFQSKSAVSPVSSLFTWNTNCSLVRNQPYQVIFRADDNAKDVTLVDIKSVSIKIVGPSPKNLSATPIGNAITLKWDKSVCTEVVGYRVYRRVGLYTGTIQCPCTTGVPAPTGFTLLKVIDGFDQNTFTDNENGKGLVPGTNYCYLVTAIYADDAESCASAQVCSVLKKDLPIITHVDITKTDAAGEIKLAWSKPTELDTLQTKGPYRYLIYHSNDFSGSNLTLIDSSGMNKGLEDTLYTHVNVNTVSTPHSYRIAFYSLADGKRILVGKTQVASSIFTSIAPTDNRLDISWEEHVPWTNTQYTIYKLNKITLIYDSIGVSTTPRFSDLNVINKISYCYKIKSKGAYSASGLVNPIINFSQEKCEAPVDNIPPCPPVLSVYPDCDLHQNLLIWNNPNRTCSDDVLKYNIYYTPVLDGKMSLLTTIDLQTDTFYLNNNMESIAGCYMVTSLDSVNNESTNGNIVCVDNCPYYELPNVFTPNNDGANDLFGPFPYRYVKDVDITIYDRWGLKVFKTSDRDIKWDGKNQVNKKECTDGVYYYVCHVHEIRLEGIKTRTLKGTISLISGTPSKNY